MQENTEKISEISERIKQVLDYLNVSVSQFAKKIGISRPQGIYDYLNGKVKPSFDFFNAFAKSEYSEKIDVSWLLTGKGEMVRGSYGSEKFPQTLIREAVMQSILEKDIMVHSKAPEVMIEMRERDINRLTALYKEISNHQQSNADPVHLQESSDIEVIKREDGTEFRHLGEERYLMVTPLINQYAYAGYVSGWSDSEYIDELPRHAIVVERLHFGTYRSFMVKGDSMDNEKKEAYSDGDIVTARRIDRKYWKNKLHLHDFKDYVIHTTDGLLIKRITEHNAATGIIKYCSLNPDKVAYPDTEISLEEVVELYNIVAKTAKI